MEIFAIQVGRLCNPALVVMVQSSNLRHLNHRPKPGILDGSRRRCILLQRAVTATTIPHLSDGPINPLIPQAVSL